MWKKSTVFCPIRSGEPLMSREPAIVSCLGSVIFKQATILSSVGQLTFRAICRRDTSNYLWWYPTPGGISNGNRVVYLLGKPAGVPVDAPWAKGHAALGDGPPDHPFVVGSEGLCTKKARGISFMQSHQNEKKKKGVAPGSWRWLHLRTPQRWWCCQDLLQMNGCSCAPKQVRLAGPKGHNFLQIGCFSQCKQELLIFLQLVIAFLTPTR